MSIANGEKICIKFTQPLTGTVVGNESKFTISFEAYNYVPGGSLSKVTRAATAVEVVDEYTLLLAFNPGVDNSIQRAVGDITVSYDGSGSLMGRGGPVLAFEQTFTPEGLDPKNNPHNAEHIELGDIRVQNELIRVYYSNVQNVEHIELADIFVTSALRHINDI